MFRTESGESEIRRRTTADPDSTPQALKSAAWFAPHEQGSFRAAPTGLDPYSGPGSQDCVRQGGLVLGYYPAAPPGPLPMHFVHLLCNSTRRVGLFPTNGGTVECGCIPGLKSETWGTQLLSGPALVLCPASQSCRKQAIVDSGHTPPRPVAQQWQVRDVREVVVDHPQILFRGHPADLVETFEVHGTGVVAKSLLPGQIEVVLEIGHD